jgi:anti-sigma B factor antagonist
VLRLLGITERRVGDVTIIDLDGQLVLDDRGMPLRDHVNQLVSEGRAKIVIGMRNVTRLDSAGIGLLVSKYLTACGKGGSLKLLQPTAYSRYLFEITKLTTVFEIFESEDEAIRSFSTERALNRQSS